MFLVNFPSVVDGGRVGMYAHLHAMHAPSVLVAVAAKEVFTNMGQRHGGDKPRYATLSARAPELIAEWMWAVSATTRHNYRRGNSHISCNLTHLIPNEPLVTRARPTISISSG